MNKHTNIMLKNTTSRYGTITIVLHWVSAIALLSQFILGLYMTSLDYYDPYYKSLPYYHKSVGILIAMLIILRILWWLGNTRPRPVVGVSDKQNQLAHWGQIVMYGLMLVIVFLGYLIPTAEGASISVFGWFEVPATLITKNQEDWATGWHHYLSVALISLAGLHALAALKHHFIDKDTTLLRMLGR